MKNEKIKVWELQIFGSKVVFASLQELMSSLECDIAEIQEPEVITISPVWIDEVEYEDLPEFEGY